MVEYQQILNRCLLITILAPWRKKPNAGGETYHMCTQTNRNALCHSYCSHNRLEPIPIVKHNTPRNVSLSQGVQKIASMFPVYIPITQEYHK